jgi:hypothetical protein
VGWEEFYLDTGEATGYFPLIAEIKEQLTSVSESLWRSAHPDWIVYGGSIAHYLRHVEEH